ncbi:MAG: DUF5685 family protein [Eubacteriales bacterium]|nr:DUF5685 family protein [Eubacteriales bacterium]
MFGYVTINTAELEERSRMRYQAYYCGLCRTLMRRYGNLGRLTLSNDMTFLFILLSSLYEPEETIHKERCLPHPVKEREGIRNELNDYCADMNIALAYHKCRDDWEDDHSLLSKAEMKLLQNAYGQVVKRYPDKCAAIEKCLTDIGTLEQQNVLEPDAPANLTARMLGEVYVYRDDYWAEPMRAIGEGVGRFIYLMDAYDDLPADLRRKRYNPLAAYHGQPDYESLLKDSLTMVIAECTQAFELLPLVQDVEILRNILYSGVWMRYQQKQAKPDREQGKLKFRPLSRVFHRPRRRRTASESHVKESDHE